MLFNVVGQNVLTTSFVSAPLFVESVIPYVLCHNRWTWFPQTYTSMGNQVLDSWLEVIPQDDEPEEALMLSIIGTILCISLEEAPRIVLDLLPYPSLETYALFRLATIDRMYRVRRLEWEHRRGNNLFLSDTLRQLGHLSQVIQLLRRHCLDSGLPFRAVNSHETPEGVVRTNEACSFSASQGRRMLQHIRPIESLVFQAIHCYT